MSLNRPVVIGSVVAVVILGGVALAKYNRSSNATSSGPFPDKDFQFGEAVQGDTVQHAFTVRNLTDAPMVLRRISPFGAVTVTRADTSIAPGQTGRVELRFDTRHKLGAVIELANVYTAADTVHPAATLRMRGTIVRPLQFAPQDRVYFFTVAGQREQRDVELINHRAKPLRITSVTSDNPAFGVTHKTVDEGKRYRISVSLDPKVAPGKYEGTIAIATDDSARTSLPLVVTAIIDDVVSTSPKEVNFSTIPLHATSEPVVGDKQVIVKKFGGTDFRVVTASTDLPFLEVVSEPYKQGESVLVRVKIKKDRAHRGDIKGTLTIETNDPAFPRLKVPIVGKIV